MRTWRPAWRCQTSETAELGIPKYTGAFQAAREAEDWEKMIVSMLRIMELRGDVYSGNNLRSFGNIALFLFKMGHEEAGDEVMRRAIELFSKSPIAHGREAAMEMFALYAIQCNHPAKAEKEADELLKPPRESSTALAVKMFMTVQRGNIPEAKALAKRIQDRESEPSIPYRLAAQVLAIDPNQPTTYNQKP